MAEVQHFHAFIVQVSVQPPHHGRIGAGPAVVQVVRHVAVTRSATPTQPAPGGHTRGDTPGKHVVPKGVKTSVKTGGAKTGGVKTSGKQVVSKQVPKQVPKQVVSKQVVPKQVVPKQVPKQAVPKRKHCQAWFAYHNNSHRTTKGTTCLAYHPRSNNIKWGEVETWIFSKQAAFNNTDNSSKTFCASKLSAYAPAPPNDRCRQQKNKSNK